MIKDKIRFISIILLTFSPVAEEWKNWLFFFSLPVITKYLPALVKNHWKDFVEIMLILCDKEIKIDVLDQGIFFLNTSDYSWLNMIIFDQFLIFFVHF
jgi:hypothetical protein